MAGGESGATVSEYNDLYVRDTFADTGTVPASGIASASPDIIPYQGNFLSWATANTNYAGPDIGKDIIDGGDNNIYVRAYNLNSTSSGSGQVSLYWSTPSLFLTPSEWILVTAPNGTSALPLLNASADTSIPSATVALSNPAFLLPGLPTGKHCCLIAVLSTTQHPLSKPANFATNSGFTNWVINNPGVSWRNVSHAPSATTSYVMTYAFANTNGDAETFYFTFVGQNYPTGTTISAVCTNAGCTFSQQVALPVPDANGKQKISFMQSISANFSGTLILTVASPNSNNFAMNATLTISFGQKTNPQNPMDVLVSRRYDTILHTPSGPVRSVVEQVPLGACLVLIASS